MSSVKDSQYSIRVGQSTRKNIARLANKRERRQVRALLTQSYGVGVSLQELDHVVR
jgi:hypothetical protein